MSPPQRYAARVLRHWLVIVAVTVLGALLTAVWAFTAATKSWTATAALTTQSQTRAPEQDAVLALGYVDYFNRDAYQQVLRTEVSIPSDVKLMAKTGATSPILYIEAAGTDADKVRTAAATAADRFRADVRVSLLAERSQTSGDIQGQIDKYVESLQERGRTQAEINVILDQIRSLQGRLTDVQSDDTNQLRPLQPTPGVADTTVSTTVGLVGGVVGGLLLGVLVALLMVVLDTRLRSAGDVRQRLGLDTVAEFGRRTSATDRARRVENLANTLSPVTSGGAVVVAVVAPRHSVAASAFTRELAITGASRRSGTILVRSDLRNGQESDRPGLVDVIDGRASISAGTSIGADGLAEMPTGRCGGRAPYAVFEPDRFAQVVEQISKSHRLVVIDVPPLLDASESQVICDVADHVLVVVDRGATRWAEARTAIALLGQVNARVTGVVLVDPHHAVTTTPVSADATGVPETEVLPIVGSKRATVAVGLRANGRPEADPEDAVEPAAPQTTAAPSANGATDTGEAARLTKAPSMAAARAIVPAPEAVAGRAHPAGAATPSPRPRRSWATSETADAAAPGGTGRATG